jgi:2'-5' RNA ligase
MSPSDTGRVQQRYDDLWSSAAPALSKGQAKLDPVLTANELDQRRGLTCLFRPAPAVAQAVAGLLEQIRELEPEQYYYQPSELHVTFLSLFTASVTPERFFARQPEYLEAVGAVAARVRPFRVRFQGITASPEAILIQGYPESEALAAGREALRRVLRERGLAETLDSRYRLETAHMTAVRFRAALKDGDRLARFIEAHRSHPFGEMEVARLQVVKSDWYMSERQSREVHSCALS